MQVSIAIQPQDFDAGQEYQQLRSSHQVGAIVTFVGLVREFTPGETLWLEHYPGMTEQVLQDLAEAAGRHWPLLGLRLVHRIGHLAAGEQIVLVGAASAHREAAFAACQWTMDHLKTSAPFWKKEGARWVAAKAQDQHLAARWSQPFAPDQDG
jgi:molybdopterin synthase catalytic subunit